jgi:hypothetical protein
LFSLIPSQKIAFNKKTKLKIDSAGSTGSHGKYIKYVSFHWPPVVAAQTLHSSESYNYFIVST